MFSKLSIWLPRGGCLEEKQKWANNNLSWCENLQSRICCRNFFLSLFLKKGVFNFFFRKNNVNKYFLFFFINFKNLFKNINLSQHCYTRNLKPFSSPLFSIMWIRMPLLWRQIESLLIVIVIFRIFFSFLLPLSASSYHMCRCLSLRWNFIFLQKSLDGVVTARSRRKLDKTWIFRSITLLSLHMNYDTKERASERINC